MEYPRNARQINDTKRFPSEGYRQYIDEALQDLNRERNSNFDSFDSFQNISHDNIKGANPKGKRINKQWFEYSSGLDIAGRTSGYGKPPANVAKRDAKHHMNKKGYGPAILDKSSTNKNAIRGREQQLIDYYGGARSKGGTSGNKINGISDKNPKKKRYLNEADKEW